MLSMRLAGDVVVVAKAFYNQGFVDVVPLL
jgi:hypothetical protein